MDYELKLAISLSKSLDYYVWALKTNCKLTEKEAKDFIISLLNGDASKPSDDLPK